MLSDIVNNFVVFYFKKLINYNIELVYKSMKIYCDKNHLNLNQLKLNTYLPTYIAKAADRIYLNLSINYDLGLKKVH